MKGLGAYGGSGPQGRLSSAPKLSSMDPLAKLNPATIKLLSAPTSSLSLISGLQLLCLEMLGQSSWHLSSMYRIALSSSCTCMQQEEDLMWARRPYNSSISPKGR